MTLTIDLPADLEARLRAQRDDFAAHATEAVVVDLYRRDLITQADVARALNLHRLEIDAVLKRHGVMLELTHDDFAADLADLREHLQQGPPHPHEGG